MKKGLLKDVMTQSEMLNLTPVYNHCFIQETPLSYFEEKKLIISDCDGVLTDGTSIVGQYPEDHGTECGKFAKIYGSYDKEAMKFMKDMNWDFAFVTADKAGFNVTNSRINHLTKKDVLLRNSSERATLVEYAFEKEGYNLIVFIGDSISDLEVLYRAPHLNMFCQISGGPRHFDLAVEYIMNTIKPIDDMHSMIRKYTSKYGGHGGFAETLYSVHLEFSKLYQSKTI